MAFKLRLNKRADISITILVIGVFVICTLAILSFLVYNQQIQGNFVNLGVVENLSSQLSDFYFYVNSGMSQQQAASLIEAQIQGTQLILNGEQMPTKSIIQSLTGSPSSQPLISVKYTVDILG